MIFIFQRKYLNRSFLSATVIWLKGLHFFFYGLFHSFSQMLSFSGMSKFLGLCEAKWMFDWLSLMFRMFTKLSYSTMSRRLPYEYEELWETSSSVRVLKFCSKTAFLELFKFASFSSSSSLTNYSSSIWERSTLWSSPSKLLLFWIWISRSCANTFGDDWAFLLIVLVNYFLSMFWLLRLF